MSGHLGAFKSWNKIRRKFFLPRMMEDIFRYVCQCELCRRTKPAQNNRVGLHQATTVSYALEIVFIDFIVTLVLIKKGNRELRDMVLPHRGEEDNVDTALFFGQD